MITNSQRLRCFDALKSIAFNDFDIHKNLINQKLSDCMMSDYSNIDYMDSAVWNFMMIYDLSPCYDYTLSQVVEKISGFRSMPHNFIESNEGSINELISALQMKNGSKHLDRMLEYIGVPPLSLIINGMENLQEVKFSEPRYSIGISFESYHFEEPDEFGRRLYLEDDLLTSSSLEDVLSEIEATINRKINEISVSLETNDEWIYNLKSVRVLKDYSPLVEFHVNKGIWQHNEWRFILSNEMKSSSIHDRDEVIGCMREAFKGNQHSRFKAALLEHEMGI